MLTVSLDTEDTGLDLFHDARPYLVTATTSEGRTLIWQWEVDPLTRHPQVSQSDVLEIADLIRRTDILVLHNAKFDYLALSRWHPETVTHWDWDKVRDTVIAGHLLASNQPHNLTDMALHYLARDIESYEISLKEAAEKARRLCRSKLPDWLIAEKHMEGHPGMEKSLWKADGWLPRALCLWAQEQARDYVPTVKRLKNGQPSKHQPSPPWWLEYADPDHPWLMVLLQYANADSTATLHLWGVVEQKIQSRSLGAIYRERMKLIPIATEMESRGVTLSAYRLAELEDDYREDVASLTDSCHGVAREYGHDLQLPRAGNNQNIRTLLLDRMGLPVVRRSKKTGEPSLDVKAMEMYEASLPAGSMPLLFIRSLASKRKRDTALLFVSGYRRFWKEVEGDTYRLHSNLNITGTDTLRWSCNNPNSQNISKGGMPCMTCRGSGCKECDDRGIDPRSLRYALGPAPGREWWSLDAKNIELRIPAYKSGEKEMIALFERPDEPPYYGSNHLLNFSAVYPDLWQDAVGKVGLDRAGPWCKKHYASTWYQWCKNGGFAVLYGAVDKPGGGGTADQAFHKRGAHALLKSRFQNMEGLNQQAIAEARRKGYVETFPDASVDPDRGYPVMCSRTEWGDVLPTVPLNYKVQSTAMWWTARAMVRVDVQLQEWKRQEGFDGFITLQVHDEIVLDFPKRGDPTTYTDVMSNNLWRIRIIQDLMEEGGRDIGVPTPTGCELHLSHWGEGISL
jgi:DNA polymerase I-like protein with 3'-5' exonuclease and polymerase domains